MLVPSSSYTWASPLSVVLVGRALDGAAAGHRVTEGNPRHTLARALSPEPPGTGGSSMALCRGARPVRLTNEGTTFSSTPGPGALTGRCVRVCACV